MQSLDVDTATSAVDEVVTGRELGQELDAVVRGRDALAEITDENVAAHREARY